MPKTVPLVDAALRLGRSYNVTLRLVLTGQLAGGRDERRQWYVTEESLERVLKAENSAGLRAVSH
jgi:hypothetical protein